MCGIRLKNRYTPQVSFYLFIVVFVFSQLSSSNRYDTNLSNKTKLLDKNCEYFSDNWDLKFSTNKYNNYFLHEKNGLGRNCHWAYSHFHSKDISNKLDKDGVDLDLKMSYLVSQIKYNQHELLIDVNNFVINKERRRKCSSCPSCKCHPNTDIINIYIKHLYIQPQKW